MKYLITAFIAFAFCYDACAQTIKSLGFNTTNGQVVANTGANVLTFTNDVKFGYDLTVSGQVISGSGVSLSFEDGSLSGGITLETNSFIAFQGASAATTRANLGFSTNLNTLWTATNAATARTNIGLPLAALTNTSNVAAVRALAGSTNSSEPYSGTFYVTDPENVVTWQLTFSNGILLSVIEL